MKFRYTSDTKNTQQLIMTDELVGKCETADETALVSPWLLDSSHLDPVMLSLAESNQKGLKQEAGQGR